MNIKNNLKLIQNMNVKAPINQKILVILEQPEQKGKIAIDNLQVVQDEGIIHDSTILGYEKGMKIKFKKHLSNKFFVEDTEYLCLVENEILAILEN